MMFQIGHDIRNKYWQYVSITFGVVLMTNNALAIVLDAGFSQSIENTSNLHHVSDDDAVGPREDTIRTSSVYLKFNEDASGLKSSVDLNIRYLDFEKNESTDVVRKSLSSEFLWLITRGHYSWYFKDNLSQTRIDSLVSFSESNTQDVNEFVTGPKLEWEVGSSTIKLDSFIYNYDYSETEDDTTSIESYFNWIRPVGGGIKLSFKYTAKAVSYDETDTLNDYDQSTLGLRFEYKKSVDQLDMFFGKTLLNNDTGGEYSSTSVSYKRQISRYSSLSMAYSNNLADQNDTIDSSGTSLTGVYIDKRYSVIYQKSNTSSGFDLKYEEQNREDDVSNNEDNRRSNTVSAYNSISSRSLVNISYSDNNNSALYFEDNIYTTKLGFQKKFNNKMALSAFVSEVIVKSSDLLRQYTDARVGFSFSISR